MTWYPYRTFHFCITHVHSLRNAGAIYLHNKDRQLQVTGPWVPCLCFVADFISQSMVGRIACSQGSFSSSVLQTLGRDFWEVLSLSACAFYPASFISHAWGLGFVGDQKTHQGGGESKQRISSHPNLNFSTLCIIANGNSGYIQIST